MKMKNFASSVAAQLFTGEHGLRFDDHHRGAQPEGWRFGDDDGVHRFEAAPLTKIGSRLRGATVGATTFGQYAEGTRRHGAKDKLTPTARAC